jgi:integrase/recombinase XerC
MGSRVVSGSAGHRIEGVGGDVDVVNAFLDHLSVRNFSAASRRAYAFDLLNFLRFLIPCRTGTFANSTPCHAEFRENLG